VKSSPFAPARPPLSCWREECSFSRKLKKYRARSFFRFLLGNIKEAVGGVCSACTPSMVRVVNSRRSHLKPRNIPSPCFLSLSLVSQNAGKTAAMLAASAGCAEILKVMNRGPSLLNLKDADGGTAAMSAAVHSHSSVLDYLIEKKVDLNAVDGDGWTALMYACSVGAADAVAKLVANGADASLKNAAGDSAMDMCKASKKRHNLIQVLNPAEPMPAVAE